MRTLRVILETVNALALGVWAGMLVFVGVAAALTFPLMKRLDPTLAAYPLYEGEHWRLAAGLVMNPLFAVVATTGNVVVTFALVAYVVDYRANRAAPGRRSFPDARLMVCFLLLIAQWLGASTLFDAMLRLFDWHKEAAQSGMNELSSGIVEEFNALHGYASPVMGGLLLLVVAYLCVCVAPALARRSEIGGER